MRGPGDLPLSMSSVLSTVAIILKSWAIFFNIWKKRIEFTIGTQSKLMKKITKHKKLYTKVPQGQGLNCVDLYLCMRSF